MLSAAFGLHPITLARVRHACFRPEMRFIIHHTKPVFSKIAYNHIGENKKIRSMLQSEFAQGALLGESQDKLVKRIMKVTGQLEYQARRVAQTERTRVQSQARYEAGQEAQSLGVRIANQWSTKMHNSREAHIKRDGLWAMQGEAFPDSDMRYPGDPAGGAAEVINCHCVLVPDVLGDDEIITADGRRVKSAEGIKSEAENETLRVASTDEEPPVLISGLQCSVTKEKFGFNDGSGGVKKQANAVIYETPDGTRFVFPEKYNKQQQRMTPEEAISLWAKVPENIRKKAQKTIQFVDYYNPQDAKWRKRYKNFTQSYATGGDTITFWRYNFDHDADYVVRTYCHEAGHFIDRSNATFFDRFSKDANWSKAMVDDIMVSGKKSCTVYGENSNVEDFAESVAEYVTDRASFKKDFPNRTAILDVLLK